LTSTVKTDGKKAGKDCKTLHKKNLYLKKDFIFKRNSSLLEIQKSRYPQCSSETVFLVCLLWQA